ncbi:hypothetical protein [Helicobacter cetorum]|uniref:Neuraminyllactose-binding hemagglutinin family protein n=1 Tax=Helicobacter cetorum (strain ATCC BAA-540 / CCUG 52418 / MIT 99-5656) TaxID=1163745 RepID=I0ETL5_HELCM|nr:hypothetical protein [Helicobacter cetorum]AFI06284.1 hypothetical protein HCD_06410 [Helicobacter cetorum MIT 99-5656]
MLKIVGVFLGVMVFTLGCFNPVGLNLTYKEKKPPLKITPNFILNPPKIFFNAHFVPLFYQKEFKKALIKQITDFLQNKSGFTLNIVGNVLISFEESARDLKAIEEKLKNSIEPMANPKNIKRFLKIKSSLILECVPKIACSFDTTAISTSLSVPILYNAHLENNPNNSNEVNKPYNDALYKALNKTFYHLMEILEKRLSEKSFVAINK